MTDIRRVAALVVLLSATIGCGGSPKRRGPEAGDDSKSQHQAQVERLSRYLTGTFANQEQANEGDGEDYLSVVVVFQPIWEERSDGPWIYVEQQVVGSQDPYRQRIYQIATSSTGSLRSEVFELPEPAAFVGAWKHPETFAALTPASLTPREGCGLIWSYDARADVFEGRTIGTTCQSVLRGASYATSTAEVSEDEIRSWDRGFDIKGQQVWGPKMGAYIYRRVVTEPADEASQAEAPTEESP